MHVILFIMSRHHAKVILDNLQQQINGKIRLIYINTITPQFTGNTNAPCGAEEVEACFCWNVSVITRETESTIRTTPPHTLTRK